METETETARRRRAVNLDLTDEEFALVRQAAAIDDRKLTHFYRRAVMAEARRIIREATTPAAPAQSAD